VVLALHNLSEQVVLPKLEEVHPVAIPQEHQLKL
jgi:hypothetical protein